MSFHRIQKATHSILKIKSSGHNFLYRSQSSSVTKGSSVRRALFGFTLISGGLVGGAIAYGHHNPNFKESVDAYIPGYSNVTERSVILWNEGTEVMKRIILPEKWKSSTPPVDNDVKLSSSADKLESENIQDNLKISSETDQSNSPPTVPPTTDPIPDPPPPPPPPPPVISSDTTTETVPESTNATPPVTPPEDTPPVTPPEDTPPVTPPDASPPVTPPEDTPPDTVPSSETSIVSTEATPIESTASEAVPPVVTTPPSVARLQEVFERYSKGSETVLSCIDELKVSLDKCNERLTEGFNNLPKDDKEIENIVGDIMTNEDAVDSAKEDLKRAKEKQTELSDQLTSALDAAGNDGATELVEMVCAKVGKYTASIEKREESIKEAEKVYETQFQEREEKQESKKIATLMNQIEEMREEGKKALEKALQEQKDGHEEILKEKLREAIEDNKKEFQRELEMMEIELRENYEEKIKERLYSQAEAQAAYTKKYLKEQAEEISQELEEKHRRAENELEEEYQKKLALAYAHLKGIHSMINTVVETSQSTRRQQSVRAASDALTNTLIAANADPNPYSKYSIKSEVKMLYEAAKNDTFIHTVLSAIPAEVLEDGIVSEASLKNRFTRIKKIAGRVALIPEEGGGLGMYLLSFLQSLLTIDMVHPRITFSGLSSVDPESLSTFDLLRQAKFSLEAGDLETTVRVLSQLKGESRRVVSNWLKDAVLYLETRQAIMAISEYLAASSAAVLQQ